MPSGVGGLLCNAEIQKNDGLQIDLALRVTQEPSAARHPLRAINDSTASYCNGRTYRNCGCSKSSKKWNAHY